jgi:hypothetical protein
VSLSKYVPIFGRLALLPSSGFKYPKRNVLLSVEDEDTADLLKGGGGASHSEDLNHSGFLPAFQAVFRMPKNVSCIMI